MKTKVLAILKPKAASLGFSAEELDNVAIHLAETLEEDATDEQITTVVDGSLPLLKLSQTAVTRIVNAKKKEKANPEQKDKDPEGKEPEKEDEEVMPKWAKALYDKIDKIEEKEVLGTRLEKFESVVKDLSDTQRKSMISDFKRITFENDEDFESYLSEKKELIPTLIQDNANAGLDKGKPGAGGSSASETDDFVNAMKSINEEPKNSDMYFKRKEASGNSYTHLWDISTVRVYDGGFGLDKSNLPTDLKELPRGAILSVDLEERTAKAIKTAELAEALTAETTEAKIRKGSLVVVGDILGLGDKSVVVAALDTSDPSFDSFEIEANALGVAPIGTILSTFKDGKAVKAAGFNSRDVKLLGEDSVSVVYAVDKVESGRLPYPITESIIADLKQCLILKK